MKSLLTFIGFLFSLIAYSQTYSGKLNGTVMDHNNDPLELANITLHRVSDSIFVKASITDKHGLFEIEDIPLDKYYVKVFKETFENYRSSDFLLNNENQAYKLETIILEPKLTVLDEIVVTKEKQFIERKLDKIIVNVENSVVSAGSNVLEVLARSPGVMVNQESSINLKGKSGVVVMIDGKVTPLSGPDLIAYLKSVPAENIQLIELISNPSSNYDAAGSAGFINIKFKKDQKLGLNGSAAIIYGQGVYPKPSVNANLNYRANKWNFFGSHSYSIPKNYTYFFINRKFFDQNRNLSSTFEQISNVQQPSTINNSRFGADFYASESTIVGVVLNGNWNVNERNGKTDATITNADGELDYTTKTDILLVENRFNGFANLNFKHSFKNGGNELTADLDYGKFDAETLQNIQNTNSNPDGSLISFNQLATNQAGTITVKSIKTDFTCPISDKSKLELGLKSSVVTSDNDLKFYDVLDGQNTLNPELSNHFIYDENINAAYASFAKELTKFDFQLGLRMEHTDTKGKQLASGESFSRIYVNFFPNVVLNRIFTEENSLSFAFTKRIDRPSYRQLNPFKVFVDSYTYVVGDPTLNSVISHLFELNYTLKSKYIATLSYNKSKESITDIFVQDDVTAISYQIPANIQDYEQYNLSIYTPFNIKKIVNSTLSISVYLNKYSSPLLGGNLQQNFTSFDVDLTNSILLGKNGWTAELNGFYQGKSVWGLFYIKDLAQVTAGIQKTSKDKKSTFKFNVSDIFKTYHVAVEVDYQNQDFFTERNWDSRVATFSYTYRFGKSTVVRARQRNSGVEDEKRRAG